MIRLSGITKSFDDGADRKNHVLRGVDLRVLAGEFVAVTGVSGSGKSTLLAVLGTLTEPDSGSYVLDGRDVLVAGVDNSKLRNQSIGFLFQDHRLLPQFTVRDNILLPTLAFQSQPQKAQSEYVHHLMSLVGASQLADHYPKTLSGGEAARVALCRALVMQPKVLLADEPTGQLDARTSEQVVALLSDVNSTLGTTLILVTHSTAVASVASRTVELRDGILY